MTQRKIRKTVTGSSAVDGAGVKLVRVIGAADVREFDPFLMLDAFDSANPADYTKGFPWHPHRGIETVTYLIEGDIEHGDSLGNKGSILDGGCQWMTAGSGIIHQEMPQATPRMLGLQLWLNLAAKDKMTEPKYRDITAAKIPVNEETGVKIAVIAGEYRNTSGAMKGDYIDATLLDIALDKGASCTIPTNPEDTVFIYIVQGSILFGDIEKPEKRESKENRRAVLLDSGDEVTIEASPESPARCILFAGKPLHEPVVWGGPIVMNTREELELAFTELDEGTFIKHK